VIVLREVEGRPLDEVAGILGCSVGSARSRAYKARNLLRERMRPFLAEEDE
jgi:DNA-directed RNA polymerase specialized sigma24 family protein